MNTTTITHREQASHYARPRTTNTTGQPGNLVLSVVSWLLGRGASSSSRGTPTTAVDADDPAAATTAAADAGEAVAAGARHAAEADLRGDAVGAREDPVDGGARVEAAEPEHVLGPERLLPRRPGGDVARAVARERDGGQQEAHDEEARGATAAAAAASLLHVWLYTTAWFASTGSTWFGSPSVSSPRTSCSARTYICRR